MALVLADRVQETSTTTGTGTLTLAGASSGYQTFSAGIGNGNVGRGNGGAPPTDVRPSSPVAIRCYTIMGAIQHAR